MYNIHSLKIYISYILQNTNICSCDLFFEQHVYVSLNSSFLWLWCPGGPVAALLPAVSLTPIISSSSFRGFEVSVLILLCSYYLLVFYFWLLKAAIFCSLRFHLCLFYLLLLRYSDLDLRILMSWVFLCFLGLTAHSYGFLISAHIFFQ